MKHAVQPNVTIALLLNKTGGGKCKNLTSGRHSFSNSRTFTTQNRRSEPNCRCHIQYSNAIQVGHDHSNLMVSLPVIFHEKHQNSTLACSTNNKVCWYFCWSISPECIHQQLQLNKSRPWFHHSQFK